MCLGVVPLSPLNLQLTPALVASTGCAAMRAHVHTGPFSDVTPCGVASSSRVCSPVTRVIVCSRARSSSNQISVSITRGTAVRRPVESSTRVVSGCCRWRTTAWRTGSSPTAASARSTRLGCTAAVVRSSPATTAAAPIAAATPVPASHHRLRRREDGAASTSASASATASSSGSPRSSNSTSGSRTVMARCPPSRDRL